MVSEVTSEPGSIPVVTASSRIAGLVLAAGAARRFGAPKQLARVDGAYLLEHALRAAAGVPALARVVVALGAEAEAILETVELHGAEPVLVEDWREGQAASLRTGVAALGDDADAVVVTLGDQPRVDAATIARVVAAWDGVASAVRATFDGLPGHPVLLARALFPAIAALEGDVGARAVLAGVDVVEVPCGAGAVLDVDTPADLEALDGTS